MLVNRWFGASSLAIVGSCLMATSVYAQGAEDGESGNVDGEIIVTAQKRSESVNSVPMSITAVSGNDLKAVGVTDVAGLAKITPGFAAVDSGFGTPVYYLRGIGFFDSSIASKPTVSVYADEAPIPYSIMTTGASFDIERVEVLKGPQGTLFGSNATGGAINYIAAKPTKSPEAGFSLSFGRFARHTAEGYASGPLSSTLSARLSLRYEGGGDWQRSLTRNASLGERSFVQGRLQFAFEPSETVRFNLTLNGQKDKSDTQAAQFASFSQLTPGSFLDPRLLTYPIASNARAADWGTANPLRKDNWQAGATLRGEVDVTDDVKLTSITSYNRFKEGYGLEADGTTLQLSDLFIDGDIKAFNQELRLGGSLMGEGSWIVGGNYEWSKTHELIAQTLPDSSPSRAFSRPPFNFPAIDVVPQLGNTKYRSYAAFADVSIPVSSTLTISGGIRYTDTKVDFEGCTQNAGNLVYGTAFSLIFGVSPPIPRGGCVTFNDVGQPVLFQGSLPENNVSWRGIVKWEPANGQMFYTSVSRGFKNGTFATLAGNRTAQYKPVVQEQVTAYEVGFKSSLLDRRLQLNGALFYYDYLNKQLKGRVVVPIFGALEALVNVPKSRVQGAELQLTARPVEGLRATIGATYIDSKVTAPFSNYTSFGQLLDFNGTEFPYTPNWQMNADLEYRHDMGGSMSAFVGAAYSYRSGTNNDFIANPILDIPSYGLLDLRAGVEDKDGRWRVSLYGQNVTNKFYWYTVTRRNDTISRFAGMPVTYGVNFEFKFK
ncbi:TonB-dependent receptor [Sphingobium chlorophenolicum L-1]|uniref:TonB-dependent receptor n=2 Tax=Sphingobium chlorophenolicum TaxID=46429 RepID=F6EUH4_SPHCR|nr:TonB-dependent receptor [Sphingobium chlorophenolicum L-1]